MKRILTITLLTIWASASWCQSGFQLDTTQFPIGDQTNLVCLGPDYPSIESLAQNDIRPLRQWFDTVVGPNGEQQVRQLTRLTCFEPGEHWLKVGNDSLLITVTDVPDVDTSSTEIKDIAPLMKEPYTFWEIFRWVLLALGVAALAWGIVFLAKKIRRKEPIVLIPKAPPIPADQQALQDLESLRQRQLWQQGKVKEYQTELTDILRQYLYKSFGINSIEMTSDQTLDAFAGSRAHTADSEQLLRQILQTADMVKFAKSMPLPHEHDRSLEHAKQFVSATWSHTHPIDKQEEGAS